jgi:hypothetical protein
MSFDVQGFRDRYRAAIHPGYNPWLHAGLVLLFGLGMMAAFLGTAAQISPGQWLAIPLTLLFMNWGEYQVHKNLGHIKRRAGKLFYQRHTGDHHSFFVEQRMPYEGRRDWRVILFPAWLVVIQSLGATAIWLLLRGLDANVAALAAATWVGGYLLYEILHACEHLPEEHPISGLPWIAQMRRLHALHHRRELMQTHNFNLVFPLTDWLYGTLYWESKERTMTRQRHVIQIEGTPEQVLAYACDVSQWPQWHPSSLKIEGRHGALTAGEGFEEDIRAGGRTAHLVWQVTEYQPGRRWCAEAQDMAGSIWLRVAYECQGQGTTTRFERIMDYRLNGWLLRLANRLFLQHKVARESQQSMLNLRQAWEGRPDADASPVR